MPNALSNPAVASQLMRSPQPKLKRGLPSDPGVGRDDLMRSRKSFEKSPSDANASEYAAHLGIEGGPYAEHGRPTSNEEVFRALAAAVGPEMARDFLYHYLLTKGGR